MCFALVFSALSVVGFAQDSYSLGHHKSTKIKFELVDNLIVLPVEVNGVRLSFILDTGLSKTILFNVINFPKDFQIDQADVVLIRGLGDGESVEAIRSENNILRIGHAINQNQDLLVIFDETINFTPRLGIAVHGIIGYDILKDFIVEINYSRSFVKLHTTEHYNYKFGHRWQTFPIELVSNKPYINVEVLLKEEEPHTLKLLIDSGGSDALWLFENDSLGIKPMEHQYFNDFLGKGLSGSIFGKRSKVELLSLGTYNLKLVNVAYPDEEAIYIARRHKERNGSIAGELLKRFNIVFDYQNRKMSLKKNANFNDPFSYNKSGITIEQDGERVVVEEDRALENLGYNKSNHNNDHQSAFVKPTYKFNLKPAFRIMELRTESPASKAGLKIGDIILSINEVLVHKYSIQDINSLFRGENEKVIRIKVDRDGKILNFRFVLKALY